MLRLFGAQCQDFNLATLGFTQQSLDLIHKMLEEPFGLILVTGATGSGKTTTLYSALRYLQQTRTPNIISLEDPVEYILSGVHQSQINHAIQYDFVTGLRAILRQDPDVIMIGEIRDSQTAKIAFDAAYTGHLVLSTLHTATIESTLLRLAGLSLDPFIVAQSLKGIISQRLVTRLCPSCGSLYGCEACQYTGNKGRIVLSEVLLPKQKGINFEDMLQTGEFYTFETDIDFKIKTGLISKKEILKI